MKKDPRIMLDCSAIAKGFGVDAVARLLERKGIKNYMVDIERLAYRHKQTCR